MVYSHLPRQPSHTPEGRPGRPGWPDGTRPSHHDNGHEPPASRANGGGRRFRPGAIALIAGRLFRPFRTHS
jgi:hypothetical protein